MHSTSEAHGSCTSSTFFQAHSVELAGRLYEQWAALGRLRETLAAAASASSSSSAASIPAAVKVPPASAAVAPAVAARSAVLS